MKIRKRKGDKSARRGNRAGLKTPRHGAEKGNRKNKGKNPERLGREQPDIEEKEPPKVSNGLRRPQKNQFAGRRGRKLKKKGKRAHRQKKRNEPRKDHRNGKWEKSGANT